MTSAAEARAAPDGAARIREDALPLSGADRSVKQFAKQFVKVSA